jgi:hypothetical protein
MKQFGVLGAALAAALVTAQSAPSPSHVPVRVLENGSKRVVIRNGQADWSIAKRCGAAGPGYVYRVERKGRVVVDDEGEPLLDDANGGRNPYGASGGLLSFAYQHARGIAPFEFGSHGGSNTSWITGRACPGEHPHGAFGVSPRCCRSSQPHRDEEGVVHWAIDVDLRTPWQDPVLRLRYEYEFARDVVRVRTTVRSLCAEPTCGDAPYEHFAKEPKFTAQVVPVAADTISVTDVTGRELTGWTGGHPRRGTEQVADDVRDRVTFTASGLTVTARGETGAWEGSGSGLDRWALDAAGFAPAPSLSDGPAPVHYATGRDTRWDCNGGSPDLQTVRQWELVGGAPGYPLAVFFHGWEGGVGHNDCEPAARHLPPPAAAFTNVFELSFASERG